MTDYVELPKYLVKSISAHLNKGGDSAEQLLEYIAHQCRISDPAYANLIRTILLSRKKQAGNKTTLDISYEEGDINIKIATPFSNFMDSINSKNPMGVLLSKFMYEFYETREPPVYQTVDKDRNNMVVTVKPYKQ